MLSKKEFYQKLSDSIVRERYLLKMNQFELVGKLKKSRQSIYNLENGKRAIDCYELFLISKAFNVSMNELLKEFESN